MKFVKPKTLFMLGIVLLGILAVPVCVFSSQAEILAKADVKQIAIGDIINYQVLFSLPLDAEIKESFIAEGMLGEFEIRDFKWTVQQEQMQKFALDYELSIFKAGGHKIPEFTVQYRTSSEEKWQALNAPAININVQSMLGDSKQLALKPIKPKIFIWKDYLFWILLLFFVGIVSWLAWLSWRKKHKVVIEEVVVDPAHVIAYRQLDKLQQENLIARGMMDEYYNRLSGCIRHYLENRFALRAPWMSTEEFLQQVKTSPVLNNAQRSALKDFLSLSDLVKFARYGSSNKEAEDAFIGARSFVDQTKQEEMQQEKSKT
jgi:hypothetical protein